MIVDPGPASTVETLIDRLGPVEPRALLLTHIHLDHAGATGCSAAAIRAEGLRPRARRAAPDRPLEALKSAGRLYGDDMWELWGEVAPVPEERVTTLSGGETVEGFRVVHAGPRHAPRLVPPRGERRRLRRRRRRRAHPALPVHDRADAAARHRRRGLARLAPRSRAGTRRAWAHPLRPGHRGDGPTGCGWRWWTRRARADEETFIARMEQELLHHSDPPRSSASSRPPRRTSSTWASSATGGRRPNDETIELPRTGGPAAAWTTTGA